MINEAYFGIALAFGLIMFIFGMVSAAQIMKPVQRPGSQMSPLPAASRQDKAARQTVPLSPLAAVQAKAIGERRRKRREGKDPLWKRTGNTGMLPAVKAPPREPRTEEIEEVQ